MQTSSCDIFKVSISTLNYTDTLELVKKWLEKNGKLRLVVTPNPEFLVMSLEDKEFKEILNRADLAIPDGSSLVWASKKLFFEARKRKLDHIDEQNIIKERVAGVDLMVDVCRVCAKFSLTVGLIGGGKNVALETSKCLRKMFPKLKVKVFGVGAVSEDGDEKGLGLVLRDFTGTDVLFVAMGMGKQEKWMEKKRSVLEKAGVRLVMGVGGSFDYISGKVARAPLWMRIRRMEWLYRLIRQPWRIRRQLALLKFVYLVYQNKR